MTSNDESVVMYNITMIGMYAVGKTSLITKLRQNRFVKSYKPSEDNKVFKHTLNQSIPELDSKTVKLSIKDCPGLSCASSNDQSFLQRKSHILCFVYDYDNSDTFDCISYLLQNTNALFDGNRIIMVVRNKVDDKEMITESAAACEEQYEAIRSIHDKIIFIKNFSAKTKSQDKIEKMFISGIESYRKSFGDLPAAGGAKRKSSRVDGLEPGQCKREKKSNGNQSKGSKTKKNKRGHRTKNGKTSSRNDRTETMKHAHENETPKTVQCGCVVL